MIKTNMVPSWRKILRIAKEHYQVYALLALIMAYYFLFHYAPMYGLKMAFQDFNPVLGFEGSPFVGLSHFEKYIQGRYFAVTLKNTLVISLYALAVGTPLPIAFALMLNTLPNGRIRRAIQTITYAPHFISTVVIVGMLKVFLSTSNGIVNIALAALTGRTYAFFAKSSYFPSLYVWSGIWQQLGWSSVIYMSALAGVDPELHEAAMCDGADRIRRIWHIDLPGIMPTIVILLIMNCGSLINVGFEKVFLMQTQTNIAASEVISTYAYKVGLEQAQYSYSAAVGMFNSVVSLVLLVTVNWISRRLTENSLW